MKNNKEMKNENSDNIAAMGIGAMIVFIALILVAAVASAVIIQTAEKLQQNAQTTGDQTQDQMASKVSPLSIVMAGAPNAGDLRMTWELSPGSDQIAFDDIAWSVNCGDDGASNGGTDAGHLGGSTAVSTNGGAGPALPGQIYEVIIDLTADCAIPGENTDHYLTIAAGNAGFTYEVLTYSAATDPGTVVV